MIRSFLELLDEQDPVLALAIHNGHEMHPALLANCGIPEADRLREEDPYTEAFADFYPNKVIVFTSRFTIDLNRRPEQAIYQNPEDCWGLPIRKIPMDETLLKELQQAYEQWYSVLDFTINRLLQTHPHLLVLDLHSFNHRRHGPDAAPDPQIDNPDVILGRNNLPHEHYPAVEKLQALLNDADVMGHKLDCRIDVKFTGGWLSRHLHQTFPGRVVCLAVEFKKIFMDEWSGKPDTAFQKELGSLFQQAVRTCQKDFIG